MDESRWLHDNEARDSETQGSAQSSGATGGFEEGGWVGGEAYAMTFPYLSVNLNPCRGESSQEEATQHAGCDADASK